jgi:hypothetical protein
MTKSAVMRAIPDRSFRILVALLAFGAPARASGEPWREKPYQQWNEIDVQRVLTNSPWSRMVTVTRTWSALKAEDLPGGALSGGRRGLPTELGESNDAIGKEVNFGIFWMSSRVTRAATARRAVLQSRMNGPTAEKYVNEPQPEYEVVVQGTDMTPFARKDENYFRDNAFLQMRKTKLKVSPSHVRYERSKEGNSVYAAIFYFPKNTPSGNSSIADDEKSVAFICRLETSTLQADFEPTKMVDQKGLAL